MSVTGLVDRLWVKIDKRGPDECWPWMAYQDADGYGRLKVEKTNRVASALVLEQVTGELANGRSALHTCDNPPCCNPGHLFWGTTAENHADRNRKGRQAKGSRQGSAKLTEAAVAAIRIAYVPRSAKTGLRQLAAAYGVSKPTIEAVVYRKGWL